MRQANVKGTLDAADVGAFRARAKSGGNAAHAGTAGASDAMDEILGNLGQVKVHDMGDAVDVNATGRDIGSYEDSVLPLLESTKGPVALALGAVAVNAGGLDARAGEFLGQPVRSVLSAGEDKERTVLLLQHVLEEAEFAILLDFIEVEIDMIRRTGGGTDGDADRIGQVRVNEMGDRSFDGGGEEHCLAIGRHGCDDLLDGGQEAHIEHAVGFIKHEVADTAEFDEFALEKIGEPAGSGDEHLGALADVLELSLFVQSTDDNRRADAGSSGKLGKGFVDLNGKFPRGGEDDRAHAESQRLGVERIQQWKDKGQGLAGAGLGGGNHIAAFEGGRNGLRLHRGRLDEAMAAEVGLQGCR